MAAGRASSFAVIALGATLLACTGLAAASAASTPRATTLHASIAVTPGKVQVAQLVTADVNHSTLPPGTSLKRLTVTWGDGTKATVLRSTASKAEHRFGHAGRFSIREVLTDSKGKSAAAAVLEIVVPVQHVYWDLFYSGSSYQLEDAVLPLSAKSKDTEIAGTAGNHLRCTAGMTTDSKGRLWVLSYPNGCSAPFPATIQVFSTPVGPSSAPALTFTLPGAGDDDLMTFDNSGNLWVEDSYNKLVYKFLGPFATSRTLVPALTLSTGTVTPSGVAVDHKGDVFVSNVKSAGSSSIAVYHAPVSGSTVPTYLNGVASPGGLTFDAQGNLYALNSTSKAPGPGLVRYNSNHLGPGASPSIVDPAGLAGKGPYGASFAWDVSGNLYMADCGNHAAVREYPLAASPFSAHLAPSVSYTNASLTSVGCAWGIAIR